MTPLVASEWLKLRTTRALPALVGAAVVISVASLAGIAVSVDQTALETTETVQRAFSVSGAGAIIVLVLGIVTSAGEYRHGTASDTFLTCPRRHRVLAAKLTTGAAVGTAAGAAIAAATLGAASVIYLARDAALPVDGGDLWLTLAGVVVYTALFAVIGVAVGAMVRNQTIAVAAALAWFGVVEHTVINLVPDLGKWLPFAAGEAVLRAPLGDLLSPPAGAVVLVGYGAAIALGGLRVVATRDA